MTAPRSQINVLVIALFVGVGVTGLGIALSTRADYRAEGAQLLGRALAITEGKTPVRQALAEPGLPVPILATAAADAAFGDPGSPLRSQAPLGAIALGLASALIVLTAGRLGGTWAALATGMAMVGMPGTLYHARTLGPEAYIALGWAALIYLSVRARRTSGPVWVVAASGAWLLALGSAHEALLFVIPWIFAMFAMPAADAAPVDPAESGRRPLATVSLNVLLPAFIAPALLVALWPHLHEQVGLRLLNLVYDPFKAFHAPVLVGGQIYDQALNQAPPFFTALWLFAIRLPPMFLLLAGVGAGLIVRAVARGHTERHGAFALFGALAYLVLFGLNGSPEYDGLDGIMSAGPFFALLAGLGGGAIVDGIEQVLPRLAGGAIGRVAVLLVCGSIPFDTGMSFPVEPAYRASYLGGTRGAAERGYDTLPDGFLPASAVQWMNASLPTGAHVAVEPSEARYRPFLESLRTLGVLRRDLATAAPYHATHVLVPRSPGYFLYRDALETLGEPDTVFEHGGVRLFGIYRY
jgi:hypothetical protein